MLFKRKVPIRGLRNLFHGVAVKPFDGRECAAVSALQGRRFLSDEAPPLPLIDCTTPGACACVYQHFKDRRTGLRRESDSGLPMRDYAAERRKQGPRRITDER